MRALPGPLTARRYRSIRQRSRRRPGWRLWLIPVRWGQTSSRQDRRRLPPRRRRDRGVLRGATAPLDVADYRLVTLVRKGFRPPDAVCAPILAPGAEQRPAHLARQGVECRTVEGDDLAAVGHERVQRRQRDRGPASGHLVADVLREAAHIERLHPRREPAAPQRKQLVVDVDPKNGPHTAMRRTPWRVRPGSRARSGRRPSHEWGSSRGGSCRGTAGGRPRRRRTPHRRRSPS